MGGGGWGGGGGRMCMHVFTHNEVEPSLTQALTMVTLISRSPLQIKWTN